MYHQKRLITHLKSGILLFSTNNLVVDADESERHPKGVRESDHFGDSAFWSVLDSLVLFGLDKLNLLSSVSWISLSPKRSQIKVAPIYLLLTPGFWELYSFSLFLDGPARLPVQKLRLSFRVKMNDFKQFAWSSVVDWVSSLATVSDSLAGCLSLHLIAQSGYHHFNCTSIWPWPDRCSSWDCCLKASNDVWICQTEIVQQSCSKRERVRLPRNSHSSARELI